MISIHTKPIRSLIDVDFKKEIKKQTDGIKRRLDNWLTNSTFSEQWYRDYTQKVIDMRVELITGLPSELEKLAKVFDAIKDHAIVAHEDHKKFRDDLIGKMGYNARRDDFYPEYFRKVNIKSCVYCNALLTVSVDADDFNKNLDLVGKFVRAKFQVDHFIPKMDYPCFCVSLFNLYPVCGPCNNVKSVRPVYFKLYNEDDKTANKSNYTFSLKTGCVADYLTSSLDPKKLEIIFSDPDKKDPKVFGVGSLLDTFDINGIYATQIDVVEELVLKRKVYNESYKKTLIDAFPDLFNKSDLSDRVLLGNYVSVRYAQTAVSQIYAGHRSGN